MVLALVIASIFSGLTVSRIGYYAPMMIASAVIMPIGAGLVYTFNINTSEGMWIGYQILVGFGVGLGMQQGALAAQTVLKKEDVPIGVTLMMFMQQLGGAIFVSVGQNVFSNKLVQGITRLLPNVSPQLIVNTGATDLRRIFSGDELSQVLVAYNEALQNVFLISVVLACLSIFGALALEWRSVKGKQGALKKGDKKTKDVSPTEKVEEQA